MGVCPAPRLARSVSASAAPLSLYIRAVTCIDGGRGFNIEAKYVKWSLRGAFLSVSHPGSPIDLIEGLRAWTNQRSLKG